MAGSTNGMQHIGKIFSLCVKKRGTFAMSKVDQVAVIALVQDIL